MSVRLVIGTQVIEFPSSGQNANFAPGIIQFAQAVTDQLSAIASQFDITPRVQILSVDVNNTIDVDSCVFPSGSVRSFTFTYAIYRVNSTTSFSEDGTVVGVYDTLNSIWILQHEFEGTRQSSGLPYNTFSMSGDQLKISTTTIGGTGYDGTNSELSYSAKTLLVSNI
jgi:hypothetical protein